MEATAFALKEGELTELEDAPGTFVFIRVVKRSRRDLKEVSPQIEKKLQAQKLKEELDRFEKENRHLDGRGILCSCRQEARFQYAV